MSLDANTPEYKGIAKCIGILVVDLCPRFFICAHIDQRRGKSDVKPGRKADRGELRQSVEIRLKGLRVMADSARYPVPCQVFIGFVVAPHSVSSGFA